MRSTPNYGANCNSLRVCPHNFLPYEAQNTAGKVSECAVAAGVLTAFFGEFPLVVVAGPIAGRVVCIAGIAVMASGLLLRENFALRKTSRTS